MSDLKIEEIDYEKHGMVLPNDQKYLIEIAISPLKIDEDKYPDITGHIGRFIYANFPTWLADSIAYHKIEFKANSETNLYTVTFIITGEPETPTH